MTEDRINVSVPYQIIDTWKMRSKRAFYAPILPEGFCKDVGAAVVAWGSFETLFEGLVFAVARAHSIPDERWRGLTFRKRRKFLADNLGQALPDCPTVVAEIQSVLDDVPPIYMRRNLAAHGRMEVQFGGQDAKGNAPETAVRLVCKGRYESREISETFTADEMDDLYYAIGELSGRLYRIIAGELGQQPTSPETLRLRAFLATNHPSHSNPATPSPPPQPSRA